MPVVYVTYGLIGSEKSDRLRIARMKTRKISWCNEIEKERKESDGAFALLKLSERLPIRIWEEAASSHVHLF